MVLPNRWENRSCARQWTAIRCSLSFAISTRLAPILPIRLVKCPSEGLRPTWFRPLPKQPLAYCPKWWFHGNDYRTRDGSCLRDYIHVSDIAHAHAGSWLFTGRKERVELRNFQPGHRKWLYRPEVINAFESQREEINYALSGRRPGDVVAIYANNESQENTWDGKPAIQPGRYDAHGLELGTEITAEKKIFFSSTDPRLNWFINHPKHTHASWYPGNRK